MASFRRDDSKEVKIQPIPEVKVFQIHASQKINKNKVVPPSPKHINTRTSSVSGSKKTFKLFFANVTSFSKQAKDFVFSKLKEYDVVLLAEMHKEGHSVLSTFRKHKLSPSYNPPIKMNEGTHGGEIVATRAHIQAKLIPKDVIDYLTSQFGPLCFAAKIVIFRKVEVLFVSVYLWVSEGLSERNNTILQTIAITARYLNLPIICFGDFNITYDEFRESGWCEKMHISLLHPQVSSTLTSTSNRVIDFGFISNSIKLMFIDIHPKLDVPWGPHIGISAEFRMRPKSISQYVQCIPKPLPMSDFISRWNALDSQQQNLAWHKARLNAMQILFKQQQKTGIAILGRPQAVLMNDIKFQGELQKSQIKEGEKLALSALSSELLVLSVAETPIDERKLYTGRSQYPKFAKKPIIKTVKNDEFCPHLNYWCTVKQLTTHVNNEYASANPNSRDKITKALADVLRTASDHYDLLSDRLRAEADVLSGLLLAHSEYTLNQILNTVCSIHTHVVSKSLNALNIKWNKHVREQLSLGGGRLFQFISQIDKQFLNVSWETHGKGETCPDQFLESQSCSWGKFWNAGNMNYINETVSECFKHFRNAALERSSHIIFGVPQLDSSLKGYRKETLGCDVWKPSELRCLPYVAKSDISESMQSSMRNVASPHQNLISLNPLLGKPNKTCRTICKTPVLYRMALRADDSVKNWEVSNKQNYDKATTGSSALLAALGRNLKAEVAFWLGKQFAVVLNDYEKFFDTLDIEQLMVESIHTNFPLERMAYALQQHIAPRVLQSNGCSSKPIQISKSILAGCKYSCDFTKVYLQRGMVKLCNKHPLANTELFVDDTTMNAVGVTNDDVLNALVPAMISFQEIVKQLRLRLSPKASIVTSNNKLTFALIKELKAYGLNFLNVKHARDLGITQAAGARRPKELLHDRLNKSKSRIMKISKIAKISKKSRKLFSGSAFAVATWGHQAAGIAESRIVQLERDALACSGIKPSGRCRTFALLSTYGVLGTPRARLIRETIRAWINLIKNIDEHLLIDVRAAWAKAKEALSSAVGSKANGIKGILSNVIYILIQANWVPVAFNVWRDHEGSIWTLTNFKVSPDVVATAIYHAFLELDLLRAARHHNGEGIQFGVDLTNTFRYPRNIKDSTDVDYQFKAAINSIISGCCWSAARINSINDNFPSSCNRCGALVEDDLHTFWTCPCNDAIEHEFITKSNVYIKDALTGVHKYPCLWLRGILPKEFTTLPDNIKPPTQQQVTLINNGDFRWDSGTYYGDGSGGKYTQFQGLRRVGCSVVRVSSDGQVEVCAYTHLPGEVQTVGRGELYALFLLLQQLAPLAIITFVTDNFNVFNTYNKGPKAATNSNNCDLYDKIFQLGYEKAIVVHVRWMPSHLGLEPGDKRPDDVSHLDVLANDRADHYAGIAAESVQVSDPIATNHIYYIELVKTIQRRLAIILINLPQRSSAKNQKPEKKPRVKLQSLISDSRHRISQKRNRLFCSVCKCNFSVGDPACKRWLQTDCQYNSEVPVSASSSTHKPVKVQFSIHLGNSNTHSSHELYSYRGLVYCNKCGVRAGTAQIRLLAKPCSVMGDYGKQVLKCINNDKLPTGLDNWPDDL